VSRLVIIAALQRELAPLVCGWNSVRLDHEGSTFRVYEQDNIAAVAGGIGSAAAGRAARAMVAQYKPETLISAGLAGAVVPDLKIGSVVTPGVIIDAASAAEYRCEHGDGVLVSAGQIADSREKSALAAKFRAQCVDMEASGVAAVAKESGIRLWCVKAISDEVDSVLPPLNQFVNDDGRFHTGKFIAWAAMRPHYWGRTLALGRSSKLATHALCSWLKNHATTVLSGQGC